MDSTEGIACNIICINNIIFAPNKGHWASARSMWHLERVLIRPFDCSKIQVWTSRERILSGMLTLWSNADTRRIITECLDISGKRQRRKELMETENPLKRSVRSIKWYEQVNWWRWQHNIECDLLGDKSCSSIGSTLIRFFLRLATWQSGVVSCRVVSKMDSFKCSLCMWTIYKFTITNFPHVHCAKLDVHETVLAQATDKEKDFHIWYDCVVSLAGIYFIWRRFYGYV